MAPDPTPRPDTGQRGLLEDCSILVIDDVPANIQVLAEALATDYQLKVAASGAEGIAVALQAPPDLILLDVMMPDIDGFDVCRALKSNPRTQRVPIIFVTARDGQEEEEAGLNLGAVDYITKPFHLPIVRARVRNHLLLKRRADILEEFAHVDSLTGIANRRRLDEVIDAELRRCMRNAIPLAVLLVDIDHFKRYNDHYGHGMGDLCLTRVAGALANTLGRAGDLVARYGGEEFAVLIPGADEANALRIAERLRSGVENLHIPHAPDCGAPHVSISVGVASRIPDATLGASALLGLADIQLYRAKSQGRNQVAG